MSIPPLATAILITWRRNGAYAQRLVADLSPEQWTSQPVAGKVMNHPAWILCHLSIYSVICAAMARGEAFIDPVDHKYGQKSEVSGNPGEYPAGVEVAAEYVRLHGEAEAAVTGVSAEGLSAANPLERWRNVHPTVGDMLVTLMVKHESGHLGQLSAWRRAMGMARVAM